MPLRSVRSSTRNAPSPSARRSAPVDTLRPRGRRPKGRRLHGRSRSRGDDRGSMEPGRAAGLLGVPAGVAPEALRGSAGASPGAARGLRGSRRAGGPTRAVHRRRLSERADRVWTFPTVSVRLSASKPPCPAAVPGGQPGPHERGRPTWGAPHTTPDEASDACWRELLSAMFDGPFSAKRRLEALLDHIERRPVTAFDTARTAMGPGR